MTLEELLTGYEFLVTYRPLADELSVEDSLPSGIETSVLAANASPDPAQTAHELCRKAAGRRTAVILPGTSFDASGTRHGRGAGWYDRFLATAPREWVRIGVCTPRQFSVVPLVRKPWDQPMDYVFILGDVCVLRRTGARTSIPGA